MVGLPDERCGERPWAAVVYPNGNPDCLMDSLRPQLAKNELPASILRLDSMPMTPSGKPDKRIVRELIRQWRGQ